MSDLIDRQYVIDALELGLENDYVDATELLAYVKQLPSVKPERKKGRWVYDGIRGRFPACKCSICGHYENADWALLQGTNFCPNCGADMRGD